MLSQIHNLFFLAVKSFFVLGAVLYAVFAVVIVRQTTSMTKNVYDKFNSILISVSYIHLFLALGLIILTLVSL